MTTRMRTLALVTTAGLVLAGLVPAGADHLPWHTCEVAGDANTFQIRRIEVPVHEPSYDEPDLRLEMDIWRPRPWSTDEGNHHAFAGMWILRARGRLAPSAYAFYDLPSWTGPMSVRFAADGGTEFGLDAPPGIALPVASAGVIDPVQGAGVVPGTLEAGTYYLVAFGEGGGRWVSRVMMRYRYQDQEITCTEVDWPGRVVGFDAADFTGGTQVFAPSHAAVQGGELTISNPYTDFLSGLFFYQPSPFPPATMHIEAGGKEGTLTQVIRSFMGGDLDLNLRAEFTGKTDTISWSMLQLDLPCNPSRPPCPDWIY